MSSWRTIRFLSIAAKRIATGLRGVRLLERSEYDRRFLKVSVKRKKELDTNQKSLVKFLSFAQYFFKTYFNILILRTLMSSNMQVDKSVFVKPPITVKGMKTLDKDAFSMKILIPGLRVPMIKTSILKKKLKASQMKIPKIKPVAELSDDDEKSKTHKLFLLDPCKYNSSDDFSDWERNVLQELGISADDFKFHEVELSYENWTASDIFRAILPDEIDNVSGFSLIGHIAHLNLKAEVMEYKNLIGQVILDKTPPVKTVVNKINTIDTEFRHFQMELLAGESNFIAQVKENGCTFEFDFSKVYWNPRLSTEHMRVIDFFQKGDVLYDVFAGVGPFAVPAAMKGLKVLANDLNPDSVKSMEGNIKRNKIKSEIQCYNLDGREFIKTVVKPDLISRWKHENDVQITTPTFIVMNLPAMAVEFLDVFPSLFADVDESLKISKWTCMPVVFCYCFSKSDDSLQDAKEQVVKTLGVADEDLSDLEARHVRKVAPNKEMMCVIFQLTKDILFGKSQTESNTGEMNREPGCKRQRTK